MEVQRGGINDSICNIQLWKRLSLEKHNFGSDRIREIATLEIIEFGKAQNWQSKWPFSATVQMHS